MDCISLTNIASVQPGSMSKYIDLIQAIYQVQDQSELISGRVCNLSDIWISFFSKIDSLITTRLVFLECRANFKNTFNVFQSKVWFPLFHQELIHQRLLGLTLEHIHIIWGGHVLPLNFKPGLRKLNACPLANFMDPVA